MNPNVLLIAAANQFDPTTNIENCAKINKSTSYIGKQRAISLDIWPVPTKGSVIESSVCRQR